MDIAKETQSLFEKFQGSNRSSWMTESNEDYDFRFGNQWTETQVADMNEKGQAPVVVNRLHPAIEQIKAMLTSKNPSFRVSPREDSDMKLAQALNGIIQYVWQISDGDMNHSRIIDDSLTRGVGYWFVYHDPTADMGKGEVKISHLPIDDVYVDPASRDPFFRDASDIIISRLYSKGALKRKLPAFKNAISNASGLFTRDQVLSRTSNQKHIFLPGDETISRDGDFGEEIRYYERYTKEFVNRWKIHETFSGKEDLLDDDKLREYLNKPAWFFNGQVYSIEKQVQELYQIEMQTYQQAVQSLEQAQMAVEQGQITEEQYAQLANSIPQPPQVQQVTFADLIEANIINVVEISVQQVKMICVAGSELLYERVLKTDEYPIIPVCNIHTGTPYPLSEVRIVKDKQKALNKTLSLVLAHASASTNIRLLSPRGAMDAETFKKEAFKPVTLLEFEPADGMAPIQMMPAPLPNELFVNMNNLKGDIDHEFGIYESMMGNSQASPQTYRATIALDEFGQRKLKNKIQVIESALTVLGRVVLSYAQELYKIEKVIRILEPNNSMTEYAINNKIYDDFGYVTDVVNDISRAKYDVIIVAGSTLPSNRYAQLDFYMECYKMGLIDRQEVLKKTEVFDYEGVLKRMSEIEQLKQALANAEEENKKLSGDLQTAQRETYHANMRTLNAEHQAKLKVKEGEVNQATEMVKMRGADAVRNATSAGKLALKEEQMKQRELANSKKK